MLGDTVKTPVELLITGVPPQLPSYKFQLAPMPKAPPFTVSVALVLEHNTDGVAKSDVGAVDVSFTIIVAGVHVVVLHRPDA